VIKTLTYFVKKGYLNTFIAGVMLFGCVVSLDRNSRIIALGNFTLFLLNVFLARLNFKMNEAEESEGLG
jgi:hypothetical protein